MRRQTREVIGRYGSLRVSKRNAFPKRNALEQSCKLCDGRRVLVHRDLTATPGFAEGKPDFLRPLANLTLPLFNLRVELEAAIH